MQYLLIYFEFFLYILFSHLDFPSFDSNCHLLSTCVVNLYFVPNFYDFLFSML